MTYLYNTGDAARKDKNALRHRLRDHGYTPLENLDKQCFMHWGQSSLPEVTPEIIDSWDQYLSTGLRLDGVAVIDVDCDTPKVAKACMKFLKKHGWEGLVRRSTKAPDRFMMVFRLSGVWDAPNIFRTDKYTDAPGDNILGSEYNGPKNVVEFQATAGRQIGAFGWHSAKDKTEYVWDNASPADVPLADLQAITSDDALRLRDELGALLENYGFARLTRARAPSVGANPVDYDLTDDMVFGGYTVESLRKACADGTYRKIPNADCSAFRPGSDSDTGSATSIDGVLNIHDFTTDVSHRHPDDKGGRQTDLTPLLDMFTEAGVSLEPKVYEPYTQFRMENIGSPLDPENKPLYQAQFKHNCKVALNRWYRAGGLMYDRIYSRSQVPGQTSNILREDCMPMVLPAFPKDGDEPASKRVDLVTAWMGNTSRVLVQGNRYDPREKDYIRRDGATFYNTYRPAIHVEGAGSTDVWDRYVVHLLPHEVEREWFLDWLAHKVHYPHIRMVVTVMVANNTGGTGRSSLGPIMSGVFGRSNVRNVKAHTFMDPKWNDWAEDHLMVYVDENSSKSGGKNYYERAKDSDYFKQMTDPDHTEMQISKKNVSAYNTNVFFSTMMFSNHIDPVMIDDADRRVTVLENGKAMSQEMGDELKAWYSDPENLSALYFKLKARDVSKFNPRVVLETDIRDRVKEVNMTTMDEAVASAKELVIKHGGVTTLKTFLDLALHEMSAITGSDISELKTAANMRGLDTSFRRDHINIKRQVMVNGVRHRLWIADDESTKDLGEHANEVLGALFLEGVKHQTDYMNSRGMYKNDAHPDENDGEQGDEEDPSKPLSH